MSFIKSLFGGAETPQPLPSPPLPKRTDPEVEAARRRQARAELLRQGRAATVMTSGQGTGDQTGVVARPEARAARLLGETA